MLAWLLVRMGRCGCLLFECPIDRSPVRPPWSSHSALFLNKEMPSLFSGFVSTTQPTLCMFRGGGVALLSCLLHHTARVLQRGWATWSYQLYGFCFIHAAHARRFAYWWGLLVSCPLDTLAPMFFQLSLRSAFHPHSMCYERRSYNLFRSIVHLHRWYNESIPGT